MPQNKFILGITGITGSGTSTVAAILQKHGWHVISADKVAHDAIKKPQPAYVKITEAFGADILQPDEEIDRKALGALVFGNAEKLAMLESFIHPQVIAITHQQLQHHEKVVIDAPLLIESGMHKMCNAVWLVTAPDETRLQRIQSRDGLTREAALRRLQSRSSDEKLHQHTSLIIQNNADLATLQAVIERNLPVL